MLVKGATDGKQWQPDIRAELNISSGYGLIPSGNELLPEPMLNFPDAIWYH